MYCGAALGTDAVREATEAAQAVANLPAPALMRRPLPAVARYSLTIDVVSASTEGLRERFGATQWEVEQWRKRSRYRLVRVGEEMQILEDVKTLEKAGVTCWALPDETARRALRPQKVMEVSRRDASTLELQVQVTDGTAPQRLLVSASDVFLIVSGPITRERRQETVSAKRPVGFRLEERFLVHAHLRSQQTPLEFDPSHLRFDPASDSSATKNLMALIATIGQDSENDIAFKFEVPALAEADTNDRLEQEQHSEKGARKRSDAAVKIFDNAGQFRLYSGWRAGIESCLNKALGSAQRAIGQAS